jgi:hypothetical protein
LYSIAPVVILSTTLQSFHHPIFAQDADPARTSNLVTFIGSNCRVTGKASEGTGAVLFDGTPCAGVHVSY